MYRDDLLSRERFCDRWDLSDCQDLQELSHIETNCSSITVIDSIGNVFVELLICIAEEAPEEVGEKVQEAREGGQGFTELLKEVGDLAAIVDVHNIHDDIHIHCNLLQIEANIRWSAISLVLASSHVGNIGCSHISDIQESFFVLIEGDDTL